MDNGRLGPRYGSYQPASSRSQPRDIPSRSRGPTDDSWGPSPSRSSAIGIPGGGGGRRRRDSFDSISSGDESDGGYPRPSASTRAPRRDLPRPQGVEVYRHTTDERNYDSISDVGLHAGHHVGIGDPTGRASTDGVYVVNPGRHIMDSQGGNVMVASSRPPSHDPLYHGEAGVFRQSHIPPMREARYGRGGPQPTHSAVFPMTPYTADGAAAMYRHHNPGSSISGPDAAGAMYSQFNRNYPMHAPHPEDQSRYYTPESRYQQTLAPRQRVSGPSDPVSSVSYNTPPRGSFIPSHRHPDDPYYDR
ncbi:MULTISPECIES: hypothetical protein [unclassified Rhizobacter]|uniref:hypothetical protein n=1 Tax=unclassified Rhizobacter TaxID=2640088 RepID=UPI0006F7C931|nr:MULTISPECIES: hypothetical protein [unclassified Rhizobacter]KQU80673.1 hypothetical protein ASC88_13955 [Rhizobacter sp. Root29]KQW09650.1 hypothetical protein ASC98_23380 [Rhizobacter sp. Root1238]KRB14661.1 hypothetical protein ASE08_09540 [Rhizobacter sp. Root16D2]